MDILNKMRVPPPILHSLPVNKIKPKQKKKVCIVKDNRENIFNNPTQKVTWKIFKDIDFTYSKYEYER